jgi:hypothetical protein
MTRSTDFRKKVLTFLEGVDAAQVVADWICYHYVETGWRFSLEDSKRVWVHACDLAWRIGHLLPCINTVREEALRPARRAFYNHIQHGAYELENLLNPIGAPFEGQLPRTRFIYAGSEKVRPAAQRLVTALDKIVMHYGWQEPASRASCMETWRILVDRAQHGDFRAIAELQEPQPAPIDERLLERLTKSANGFWQAVLYDLANDLGPQCRASYAKAMEPKARKRVIAALISHPGWKAKQIAEAVGLNPRHMLRALPKFKEWRAMAKAFARAEAEMQSPPDQKGRARPRGSGKRVPLDDIPAPEEE